MNVTLFNYHFAFAISCRFSRGGLAVLPRAISSLSVAMSSPRSVASRLPPWASRGKRSIVLRGWAVFRSKTKICSRVGQRTQSAGNMPRPKPGLSLPAGPDVFDPAAVFVFQADPIQFVSAGNKIIIGGAQQIEGIFRLRRRFAKGSCRSGRRRRKFADCRPGRHKACPDDTGKDSSRAANARPSEARSPCRWRGYRLTHCRRPSSILIAATAPRLVLK